MNEPEDLVREWFEEARRSGDERLPAERILAERLGLSRAALRRGLAALDAEGLLLRQVGRGTFLSGPAGEEARSTVFEGPNGSISEAVGHASPRQAVMARLTLEPKLARLAAREASARDLALLREAETSVLAARDWASFDQADAAFHHAIAAATANPLLLHVHAMLTTATGTLAWGRLRERTGFSREAVQVAGEHHERIRAAIEERDSDAAEAALTHHLMVESATILTGLV